MQSHNLQWLLLPAKEAQPICQALVVMALLALHSQGHQIQTC